MKAFLPFTSHAAVLDRPDVDTDQIVPKQFLKRIERTGFGEFLFFDWRKDPGFELNRPEAEGARILLAGRNFGCGSSREHAAWALEDYGFDVVVAPSFGDIFRQNATKIGLLPIALPQEQVKELIARAADGEALSVDLETQTIGRDPVRVRPAPAAFTAPRPRRDRAHARARGCDRRLRGRAPAARGHDVAPGGVEGTLVTTCCLPAEPCVISRPGRSRRP